MGRRKRRSSAAKNRRKTAPSNPPDPTAADPGQSPPDARRLPQSNHPESNHLAADPPRPNKGFLAVTVLLQVAWVIFLLIMALSG